AANSARDHCFIGKSIAGNIDYQVGTVQIKNIGLEQEKVDELVERFYSHLTKESYYSAMFSERKVDIEKLKERQKVFISRLINNETPDTDHENVKRVQDRHPFHTSPERAETWLGLMEKTIDEMGFDKEIKNVLMTKMNNLMASMIRK
ncbi:MAG TPA: protoglobin domain-containing protein, partial [Bacillales bacterium]|nr:protoglobin domain-containing protein [Bacillales bacterium]